MQTNFTEAQLQDPGIARANQILRACVHCGFCTATCPSYVVLGDELDSPRGRIYLIKDMLENDRPADEKTVTHLDRCLSCLACMTTCPSGVHYMHLVDHARAHIERTYRRPLPDRALRWLLARVLPYPGRFRLALAGARLARPFRRLVPGKLGAMIDFVPASIAAPARHDQPQVHRAQGERKYRVALMTGCAQRALNNDINAATIRLLTRHGCDVVIPRGTGCCGALVHHMGKTEEGHAFAAANIRAWSREAEGEGLDAIIINTSGCGTTIKDYGHLFERDPLAEDAARASKLAKDITEFMAGIGLQDPSAPRLRVAYHAACSLQHGQKVTKAPKQLLTAAGFEVVEPRDAHLCCGSAGTYNLLQPEISAELKRRKVATIEATRPQVIAAGNIGCMMQIGSGTGIPIVHTAELLDWATGGPVPPSLGRWPLPRPRSAAWLALAAALLAVPLPAAEKGRGKLLQGDEAVEWRGVGRVNVGGLRTRGLCTGTLIAPDIVLTAAHCIVHQRTGIPHRLASIYFVAGWLKGEMSGHSVAEAVSVHPFYSPGASNNPHVLMADLALIRLREPLGPEVAQPFAVAAPPPLGSPITVVSYRRDRPHALTFQDDCTFDFKEGPIMALGCPVASGASGAPVLAEIDGGMRVVGTLVAMNTDGQAFAIQVGGAVENLLKSLDDPDAPAASH